jgi:hypothetical protein
MARWKISSLTINERYTEFSLSVFTLIAWSVGVVKKKPRLQPGLRYVVKERPKTTPKAGTTKRNKSSRSCQAQSLEIPEACLPGSAAPDASFAKCLEYLKKPGMENKLANFEKELCPQHTVPAHAGYGHTKECKALNEICAGDESDRRFLLWRLEALLRYERANPHERLPKWARNEVRRAQRHLMDAARSVEKYDVVRKKLEKRIKQELEQDKGAGPFHFEGYAANLKRAAELAGHPLKSRRAYLFGSAQKWVLANILHRFPQANDSVLALLLSWSLKRPIKPKTLRSWRKYKNNRAFVELTGNDISLY